MKLCDGPPLRPFSVANGLASLFRSRPETSELRSEPVVFQGSDTRSSSRSVLRLAEA
jgi:hypothetical protein